MLSAGKRSAPLEEGLKGEKNTMKLRTSIALLGIAALSSVATADTVSAFYGWEDGGTILGSYGNLGSAENYNWGGAQGSVLAITEDPMGDREEKIITQT